MAATSIDERSREVLRTLIQLHIATGEPVGSESLSRLVARRLSPATLRNIMADLERLGLLDHPHTSAGRLPTDEGYRVYVDQLMAQQPLPPLEAADIESSLRAGEASPLQVLETASRVLSRLSHNIGFVLVPDIGRTSFMRIDLVRLPPPRILVVLVSGSGIVTNKVAELEEELTQDQLQACANYLNAHFSGMTLDAIRARLLQLMREEKALYDTLLKNVVSVGERAFADLPGGSNVYLDGAANILEQPEFEDVGRMRTLFRTFEEKSRLVKILNACLAGDGVRILIGRENPDPQLRGMSLVTASYPLSGDGSWGVGVMGSTRMQYAHMIALVDHVARAVTHALLETGS